MNLPTRSECEKLFSQYNTPQNVIQHSKKVNQIAVFLATKLKDNGIDINIELVDYASLLHDLVRLPEQVKDPELKKLHHAEVNYQILKDKYPEIAETVVTHKLENLLDWKTLDNWEKIIVNYADKRVNNDEIVSITDRINLGKKRWKVKIIEDKSEEILIELKKLEQKIFNKIKLKPEDINDI